MSERKSTNKVGLVGTGMVGASFAYSLMQRGLASELVLIDSDTARAEGEAMDLSDGLPFVQPMRVRAGGYADLVDAEVVVICAGANQRPGETRLDLLEKNAAVFRDIVPKINAVTEDAILLVATNPVDILTSIAAQIVGSRRGRVLGSGTLLDTARFRHSLGAYYAVDARSVHAYIVGEHGDSGLALWSLVNIAGVRLRDFIGPNGQAYDPAALAGLADHTRNAALEIIQRKKATYYAIGLALVTIVEAVLRDQHTVLTVASPLTGQYGVADIALSLPSVVGHRGIEAVLDPPLTASELVAFQQSGQILKDRLSRLS